MTKYLMDEFEKKVWPAQDVASEEFQFLLYDQGLPGAQSSNPTHDWSQTTTHTGQITLTKLLSLR